ncbi:hypothetical protein PGTUg99_004307 [Puccinia graminis f. sp. tritici]|uniref:Zinc finger PHD-type domain-containing protein n=1 Tax=Puccinia graminis f. sp. tritici TaxID=56615 RepID=A0A5B0RWK0_PUCGR|nr:hypothetical protein PGTUg99_004307 [Puccinia graminis f. sp. tritici]
MPTKETSIGEASRSIPPLSRSAQPLHNPSGFTSTRTRSVGNYHQPPSHQLNSPHHPPLSPSHPNLLSSAAQVPSNLTNTYSNPSARHPPYGDHYQLLPQPPPPPNHYRHQKPSPTSSTLPHPSSTPSKQTHHLQNLSSQHCLPPEEPRKIAGFKRKSSASPSPELHPENNNHLHQSNDAPNRRTSSAWGLSSSPHSTGNHHLIQLSSIRQADPPRFTSIFVRLLIVFSDHSSQDYHQSSYYPTQPQNFKALPSEACESVPSSLAGLLSTTHHPGAPRPPTEPHQIDVPDPTPVEISMSRRDPNRSRGRATINKPSTSQINPQIHHPSTPLSSASQRPLSAEQQWSSHHRSSVGSSPQISRTAMLSTLDPVEGSTRLAYSKPSTPLNTNQTLPERTSTAYGHPYRPENHHNAGSNDSQQPRSPAVYYHSYSTHRQPLHHQHHQVVYPSPVSHDHRPELSLRTNFSQPAIRHSSLSTPDGHSHSALSPSRADPDPKPSYRLSHHQSPSYEHQFLHPSQNRPHHPDTSRPSPSISNNSLPYQTSRPSTSSSHTNQHMSVGVVSQQSRPSHNVDSPTASPDRPRLYQPEPRRVAPSSPDLQLQISPRHQNADLYPSQAPTERLSQQPFRSSHPQPPSSAHASPDAHFNSPRQFDHNFEQLHSSAQGPPRHRSSRSTDLSNHAQPFRQPRPQPVYMHELSPKFHHPPGHSSQAESSFHRNQHAATERPQQPSSHEPEGSPRARLPSDRSVGEQPRFGQPLPENITVQHATYLRREPLASPTAMPPHPPYPSPLQRQPVSAHYEHQHRQNTGQHRQVTQMKPPSTKILNSTVIGADQFPDVRPTVGSSHGALSVHQVVRSQARSNGLPTPHEYPFDISQGLHTQHKNNGMASSHPRRNSRPGKVAKADERSNTSNLQIRTQAVAHTAEMLPNYADASNASSSNKPGGGREKLSKSSPKASLLERPKSKGLPNVPQPRTMAQAGFSTGQARLKLKPKFPPLRRPSSPSSKYSHNKAKDVIEDVSPESSRPTVAATTTASIAECDSSTEPSSTGDEAADDMADDGVIRCICSVTTDDGFTIQCETCEVWQHAVCVNVPIDEVPEHYFCDRCDPSPERRKQLIEMAPQAERIQRQRIKKEADARSQDQPTEENSIAHGSPSPSNPPGVDEQDESLADSPAASTAMSRVSSGVCVNESLQGEPSGQSPNSNAKGKTKAASSGHLEKSAYPDNGLGLSGLQDSPTSLSAPRVDESSLPREPIPRKPGRKPNKFSQPKPHVFKQPLDQAISGLTGNNILDSENNPSAANGADTDDKYEPWRYEYTPTLKDLYMDADVKSQVQQLIMQYMRLRSSCEDTILVGSDAELPAQEIDSAEKTRLPPPIKPLSTSTEPCRSPIQVLDHLTQTSDTPLKSQRPVPPAFTSTQFLPVTMSELPTPSRLMIKPIPPATINLFPSLATNPFCPTFSNSLNNSSTSSLPRLITHGVFSAQQIPRGSFIASLTGSITTIKKYTEDVYNQYPSLGCNKPYVKFFKSTKLDNRFLRDEDSAQIDDGLVIDSRQYGNEMRFVRNGCHPNAFINIIMTPQAPCSRDPQPPDGSAISRSGTPSSRTCAFPTSGLDRHHHSNNLWSTGDRDHSLPWEVSFGIFAASDISRRDEIILPWEWDDQHLVHLLPRLLSHSITFEAQQQRSPALPPVRLQFLPWSTNDLKLLSCKLAAVTLTFFGLMFCGCERKRSCAVNLMWKVGCLSAGEPMFPTHQDGSLDIEASELTPISSLKERQETRLPLTFEERLRLVLYSFLEQPNPVPLKISRHPNSAANPPTISRPKKQKVDLGPLLGLRRDWWLYPPVQPEQADTSQLDKTITKKQKRPRSRSVANRKPSVHKIRRVSDVGELRQPGLTMTNSLPENKVSLPAVETSQASNLHPTSLAQAELPVTDPDSQTSLQAQSAQPSHHNIPLSSPPASQDPSHVNLQSSTALPVTAHDTSQCNLTRQQEDRDTRPEDCVSEGMDASSRVVSQLNQVFQSELSTVGDEDLPGQSVQACEAQSDVQTAFEAKPSMEVAADSQLAASQEKHTLQGTADLPERSSPHVEADGPPCPPADVLFEQTKPSSPPEEGEVQEEEGYSQETAEQLPTHNSPPGPTPGYQFPQSVSDASKLEEIFQRAPGVEPEPGDPSEAGHRGQVIDGIVNTMVPASDPPSQFSPQNEIRNPENQRHTLESSITELPSPGQVDEAIVTDHHLVNVSGPQDSPGFDAQHHETDGSAGAPPDRSHVAKIPISCQTPPSELTISILAQDVSQPPGSVPDLTPEPMVTSPKSLGVQESHVSSVTQNDKPDSATKADFFRKLSEPLCDVDTSEVGRIEGDDCEASTIENQGANPTADIVSNVTDQLISAEEGKTLDLPSQTGIRPSPDSLLSPPLNQAVEQMRADSPARLSQRSVSTGCESHFDAQGTQPSEASEEQLLDSDASTTILGSSDEEMLSSHTPRYLNNRKRIRSKNILKPPPRVANGKKPGSIQAQRSSGLPAGSMTRLNKPEVQAVNKLKPLSVGYPKGNSNKTSSLSDLDSDDDTRDNSTDPVAKESSSKMRLIIRSSSPSENEVDQLDKVTDSKQRRRSKVSPIPSLSSAPDPTSNSYAHAVAKKMERPGPAPASISSVPCSLESHPYQRTSNNGAVKSAEQIIPDHPDHGVPNAPPKPVAVNSTFGVPERPENTFSAAALPLAIIEKQESDSPEPNGQGSSISIDCSADAQLSDLLPDPNIPAPELNPPADPCKNTSLRSPVEKSQAQLKKAAPKRISLKDYRSRKVSESVVITPLANPLIHFTTKRPTPTTPIEESQRKQPPPPLIPALPPLLPPSSQSQPLLPLSPRKLELVASVLKKEEKDRARSSKDGELKSEDRIPEVATTLPKSPSSATRAAPDDNAETCDVPVKEVDLKKSPNQTAVGLTRINSELQQVKISSQDGEGPVVGAYEDDIDGVAIESMSTPSEDELDDEGRQQEGLVHREEPVSNQEQQEMLGQEKEEARSEKKQLPDQAQQKKCNEVIQRVLGEEEPEPPKEEQMPATKQGERLQVQKLGVEESHSQQRGPDRSRTTNALKETKLPVIDEATRQPIRDAKITMEVDDVHSCPEMKTLAPDQPLPPRPAEHISVQPEDNGEEDMDISPTVVQHPPPPKPRLSLADYRLRKVRRPSVPEEPRPSQSMSPSVTDVELSRVNRQSSIASPQSLQQIPLQNTQPSQQETENQQSNTSSSSAPVADEARQSPASSSRPNQSPLPSQQSEHKPNVDNAELTDTTVNATTDLCPTDTSMYFPPISPSILMAVESPRSPQMKSSPSPPGSPSEETSVGHANHLAASCPPSQHSPSRTLLDFALAGDLKPRITNQPILPRLALSTSKTSDPETLNDRPPGQTALSAPESISTLSPSHRQSSLKSPSTSSTSQANISQCNRPDHPKSSPSVHLSSLPVAMPSNALVHQHQKPNPAVNGGSQPTPIGFNAPNLRVQTPSEGTFPGPHGDQPVTHPPSSRLMQGPSSQRSPTIPLSPLVYKPSISPASPASAELQPNSRGSSNMPHGLNRDPPSRTLRAPPNPNSSRASWPPESAGPSSHNNHQYSSQGPTGAAHVAVTTKNFSDMPSNPTLPPHPSHSAGAPRNSPYHYPPHRGGGGFCAHATFLRASGYYYPQSWVPLALVPLAHFVNRSKVATKVCFGAQFTVISSSYPVRGRGQSERGWPISSSSYWPLENNPGGGGVGGNVNGGNNSAGRGFGGPPRNDR